MRAATGFLICAAAGLASCSEPLRPSDVSRPSMQSAAAFALVSTIALTTTRDDPASAAAALEVYLLDADGTNPRRLTTNAFGDAFPVLSPDGKKIVFDSNRRRSETEPLNTSDLFVMSPDGTEQEFLTRGSSASWSPDGKYIAFHRSASGTGLPIKPDPGAATFDSDIFVANVDEVLAGVVAPTNLTNSPAAIDDDPDWSPDGERIVFTSHDVNDNHMNSVTAEIYVINADGSGGLERRTTNAEEERAPAWSPDGTRLAFMCRRGGTDFEICVMNADGTGQVQLTDNAVLDATPTWSPDGQQILFHRPTGGRNQLWVMNADGTGQVQLTNTPGQNLLANWGELRVRVAP